MENEDDSVYFVASCTVLHNLCQKFDDEEENYEPEKNGIVVDEALSSSKGKRIRKALLEYTRQRRNN